METEGSQTATGSYAEPDESSNIFTIYLRRMSILASNLHLSRPTDQNFV
jgi:hypothetical protein